MNPQKPKNLAKTTQNSGQITTKDGDVMDTISYKIKNLDKIVPIVGVLYTLAIVCYQIYPQVDWSQIHIEITLDLIAFGVITAIVLLTKLYFVVVFEKKGSVQIDPPISFDDSIDQEEMDKEFKEQNFSSEFVTTKSSLEQQLSNGELREIYNKRIEQLTDLAEEAFPRGKGAGKMSYAESRNERRDAFRIWTRFNPETAQIIYYNGEPIGMSLMLRISKDSYTRYSNNQLRSWQIEMRELIKTDEQDTPYLFFQYIYCKNDRKYNASKYMCWVFLNHLSIFWKSSGREPILIAPRITKMGQVNAELLGFKRCGEDLLFPLYELDLRHPDELNKKGQEVYRVLQQLIT